MRITITFGTRFLPPSGEERYEETGRSELDVSGGMTIREVIERVDRASPPPHPGSSYISFPQPHEPLPEASTLDQLGVKDGATLRRFSHLR
jgi:hypothetical protein